ncbi:anthranilate synthase family protein [Brevibacterium picturae]
MSSAEAAADTPISVLRIEHEFRLSRERALHLLPDRPLGFGEYHYEPCDSEYERLVQRIIAEDITDGKGSNFVVPRCLVADSEVRDAESRSAIFSRLLRSEPEAYMTFMFDLGSAALIGASPEMHVRLDTSGLVTMNPISGTCSHDESGPTAAQLQEFLVDEKERDELHMVVDEELKMLASICDSTPTAEGPYLKRMSRVTHTEYYLTGHTTNSVVDVLRSTMFAPTVLGSPVESAFHVAAERDVAPRRYFGGVFARLDQHAHGTQLDSAIMIRTLEVAASGRMRYPVGATLVRGSNPASEVAETVGKSQGILSVLGAGLTEDASDVVGEHLQMRREFLAPYWTGATISAMSPLTGTALIIDHQDSFTQMLARMLQDLGMHVEVGTDPPIERAMAADLLVLGPGPGDPEDYSDERIVKARRWASDALDGHFERVLAVCLSHQLVCQNLGFPIRRLPFPNQGSFSCVDLWGKRRQLAFYNSYAAYSAGRALVGARALASDNLTGEIFALSMPGLETMQFHPESSISVDGIAVLCDAVCRLFEGS